MQLASNAIFGANMPDASLFGRFTLNCDNRSLLWQFTAFLLDPILRYRVENFLCELGN